MQKLRRTQERNFSAHHMLIEAARRANERAQISEQGWPFEALTTITFSALALEALSNAVGSKTISNWQDFESSSLNAKMQIIATKIGLEYDKSMEPWKTARWLISFRNKIAHAKPEIITTDKILTREELDKKMFDFPESKLEGQISLQNASRSLAAATAIKDSFCSKLSYEEAMGITFDGWEGSTEVHND